MRLAEHADEVLANANFDAHFTIDAALATISKPKSNSAELVAPVLQGAGVSKGDRQHSPCANGEAVAALQSDLAEIHSRGETGRILQAITMVTEIGITPGDAAGVVSRTAVQNHTPTLRKSTEFEFWNRRVTRPIPPRLAGWVTATRQCSAFVAKPSTQVLGT